MNFFVLPLHLRYHLSKIYQGKCVLSPTFGLCCWC